MWKAEASCAASPSRVWQVMSNITAWPEMLPTCDAVEPVDNNQAGPGVNAAYVVRQPRLPKARWVITDWRPGEAFTWVSVVPGIRTTGIHEVTENPDGSTLRVGIDWSGPLAWLPKLLYSRLTKRYLQTEVTTFARLAESQ
ncbi:polyketide cyclase [Actinobacteria bacterium YIM 96077]|uniref:Polyketide cyclase n=1 Tax=Phytoactinopolyspora halophila TaxID=1981511 RepID=A0A329QLK7_9ACTN|nr:SRPBCC family protein [Phytoactinopolyspora halophila]AYY14859.1 polyketide cyclase [Actinobacteria bacterium YIM 96077]RAW13133.1 polyketide cyclase [Phytoactinopolyspora halophila]